MWDDVGKADVSGNIKAEVRCGGRSGGMWRAGWAWCCIVMTLARWRVEARGCSYYWPAGRRG